MLKMLKKIIITLIILNGVINADSIPANHYIVYNGTYITNISKYPEYQFLECVYAPGDIYIGCSKIVDNQLLQRGHKLNSFWITSIKKSTFEELGGIDDLGSELSQQIVKYLVDKDRRKHPFGPLYFYDDTNLGKTQDYIDNKYSITAQKYYYEINKMSDSNITLQLKQRVVFFDDDTNRTINF